MNKNAFRRELRKGLGSAVLEIEKAPSNPDYISVLKDGCFRGMPVPQWFRGSYGTYLYLAIARTDQKDIFEKELTEYYTGMLPWGLFLQTTEILSELAMEGSDKSKEALFQKYDQIKELLEGPGRHPAKYDVGRQMTQLMIARMKLSGYEGFKKCASDAGEIIQSRKGKKPWDWSLFLAEAKSRFRAHRIQKYLAASALKDQGTQIFAKAIAKEKEKSPVGRSQGWNLGMDAAAYMVHAKTQADLPEKNQDGAKAREFALEASETEVRSLAQKANFTRETELKIQMLLPFCHVDFPLDPKLLAPGVYGDSKRLRDVTEEILKRIRSELGHQLALEHLDNGRVEAGLSLLVKNYEAKDDGAIKDAVQRSKVISPEAEALLARLYLDHRSKNAGPVLNHVFENGNCGPGRLAIARAMNKNNLLTEEFLAWCMLDAYGELRKYGRRIAGIRGLPVLDGERK